MAGGGVASGVRGERRLQRAGGARRRRVRRQVPIDDQREYARQQHRHNESSAERSGARGVLVSSVQHHDTSILKPSIDLTSVYYERDRLLGARSYTWKQKGVMANALTPRWV